MTLARGMAALALLAALALPGCAGNAQGELTARLAPLVGEREDVLLRRIGVPNRNFETGDRRFLAYVNRWADFAPGPFLGYGAGFYGAPGFGIGWGYGAIPPPVERYCEITFELAEAQVLGFTLRGNACGWGSWPIVGPA